MTGLVESRSRRGYYVSTFSAEQVVDLYEFRKILEVHAVQLATKNATPSHLQEFDRILEDLKKLTSDLTDHADAVKLDMEIHELIARASGNASLHQVMQNVLDTVMWLVSVELSDKGALAAAHRQHQAILHMIKKKDSEGAAALIRTHVESAQESLVKVLQARDKIRNAVLMAAPSKRRASG